MVKAQVWSLFFSFFLTSEDIARAADIWVTVIINNATAQMQGPNVWIPNF